MAASYEDRDGKIWMDGELVDWRDARVHILTHALHYASAVFEGERCYDGKIFKCREHSERLLKSGELIDMEIPYTADQIDAAVAKVSHVPQVVSSLVASQLRHAPLDDLLFPPAELLHHASRFTRLRPGDLVLTGTPAGVGAGRLHVEHDGGRAGGCGLLGHLAGAGLGRRQKSAAGNAALEFEPSEEAILETLLPKNLTVQIYRALLENAASEQGARMSAMDSATRNAGEMIKKQTLIYNRTRQAMITKELIEIISGAEAL